MNCAYHKSHGIERKATRTINDEPMCDACYSGQAIVPEQHQGYDNMKELYKSTRRAYARGERSVYEPTTFTHIVGRAAKKYH